MQVVNIACMLQTAERSDIYRVFSLLQQQHKLGLQSQVLVHAACSHCERLHFPSHLIEINIELRPTVIVIKVQPR
jgi:hypothetical protein